MAVTLRRSVRLVLAPDAAAAGVNGFGGVPSHSGLVPRVEVEVECSGEPDPVTGYLIDIKRVDRAVRASVASLLLAGEARGASLPSLVGPVLFSLRDSLPVEVASVTVRPSPYHACEMRADRPDRVIYRASLEFSASHRLHVPGWTAEENLAQFGKCANPNGHGHNYRIEVGVELPTAGAADCARLEPIVDDAVISRFDHKHLNLDTREFNDSGGVIPSVENIARVCFELLESPVESGMRGGRLVSVRVWETDRTSCEYTGADRA